MIIRQLSYYFIIFLTVCLMGCEHHQTLAPVTHPQALGGDSGQKVVALEELNRLGLQYHFENSHLVVLVPVKKYFQKDTIHLKAGYNKKVTRLAQLLQQYSLSHPVHSIRLVGYPGTKGADAGLLLPHQYAVVVAGYLWDHGLPMRMSGNIATRSDKHWVKMALPRAKSSHGVVIELS